MPPRNLSSPYHYIVVHVSPPTDHLALRYAIQKALQRLFGVARAGIAVDVLHHDQEAETATGEEQGRTILRVAAEDAKFVLAALPTWSSPTMRVLKNGPFLPGLDTLDEP